MLKNKQKNKLQAKNSHKDIACSKQIKNKSSKRFLQKSLEERFSFQLKDPYKKCSNTNKRSLSQTSNNRGSLIMKSTNFQPIKSINRLTDVSKANKSLSDHFQCQFNNSKTSKNQQFLQNFCVNEFVANYMRKYQKISIKNAKRSQRQKQNLLNQLKLYAKDLQNKCHQKLNYAHVVEQRVQQYEMQQNLFKNIKKRNK